MSLAPALTTSVLKTATRGEWLDQFSSSDRPFAEKLLNAVHVVSHDEFFNVMCTLIMGAFDRKEGAVGLYPEREVRKRLGVPHRLFKERLSARKRPSRKKKRSAFGEAPAVFARMRGDRIEVGSEGVVASLIGQLARRQPNRYVSVPGPGLIRKKHIRHFAVVTDFIGSGDRICDYLNSAWSVRSVRSWHSSKLIRFTVFAYSGTRQGVARIKNHPSSPTIVTAREAPTIRTQFDRPDWSALRNICVKYNRGLPSRALGYQNGEVLLSFKHGCPNNVPAIFHDDTDKWKPIFLNRTSIRTSDSLGSKLKEFDFFAAFSALKFPEYAQGKKFLTLPLQSKKLVLFLAALRAGLRSAEAQCDRLGLGLHELAALKILAMKHQLVTSENRLTDLGIGSLDTLLSNARDGNLRVTSPPSVYYYPTQLRVP
ncbi:phosphoribosyltransferase-like protein [Burkholderia pyrrocinia]|uniref:phosphoribosyltransferase-like protein n=2 Tax=Burkholderia TaxID=32008 RepID=UPI0026D99B46